MLKNYNSTRLACYIGYITQAMSINLCPLFFIIFQNRYHVSFAEIAQIVLITFLIQLSVDFVSIGLVEKIGYRVATVTAHVLATVGLILLGILPCVMENAYAGILISVFFYSAGGGMTEVVISPLIDAIPSDAKASSMSLLHSFYSWGQCLVVLFTTLGLMLIGQENWMLLPFFWALVPAADIILFALVPLPPMQKTESGRSGFRLLLGSGKFYVFILLMFCSGAGEMAISQWASLFAEKALGVSKVVGDLLGPCLFGVLMGLGRVLYGFCGKKIRILSALLFCSVLSMICYGMTVFCNAPILALIGCALCGFGVSLMWPGVLSLSAEKFSHAGTAMFAILALAGDFGCSCGPYIAGLVSDITAAGKIGVFPGIQGAAEQLALKNGMLAAMIFPLIMFIILLIMQLHRGKQK